MIVWPLHSVLLFFSILYLSLSVEVPCCCPKFDISLNCSNVSDKVKLVNNGFQCLAKAKSNVELNCNVGDIDSSAIKSTEYNFWKAEEVSQATPISVWNSNKHELTDTECGRSAKSSKTCTLSSVKWMKEGSTYTDHDSMVYQCQAKITLIDDSTVTIYSNTMWLDVQQNIDVSAQKADTEGNVNVRTDYPETKIACAIPDTNPPSKAVWYKLDGTKWQSINLIEDPRKFVVEKVIHSTSSAASLVFNEGTLVIMFLKAGDDGSYKCNVTYSDSFGTATTYAKVTKYTIVRNTVSTTDKGTLAIVSQITEHKYITNTDTSSFTCQGRDIDASVATAPPYRYSWSYKSGSKFIQMNETSKTWSGITFSQQNRTLSFVANHNMTGTEFYCTVSKTVNKVDKETRSDKFVPPAILPQRYNIPSTTNQCHDDTAKLLTIEPNKVYFAEPDENYNSEVSKQNLSGTSFVWMEGSHQLSTFDKQFKVANGYKIEMDITKETTNNNKCRYFQLIRVFSKIYQIQEVFGLIRPNAPVDRSADKCGSFSKSDFEIKCSDKGAVSVTILANKGCIRATLKKSNSDDIITEKIYSCQTTADDVLCIRNKNCNDSETYVVKLVPDGSSLAISTTFKTGTLCSTPITSSCPDSSAENISDFINVTCNSVAIKKGCWDVSYWQIGEATKTNSTNSCQGSSVKIPDKYNSSYLRFLYKCYDNGQLINYQNVSSMKNVSMRDICPVEEDGKDRTTVIAVVVVVVGLIFIVVIVIVCIVCKNNIMICFKIDYEHNKNDDANGGKKVSQIPGGDTADEGYHNVSPAGSISNMTEIPAAVDKTDGQAEIGNTSSMTDVAL